MKRFEKKNLHVGYFVDEAWQLGTNRVNLDSIRKGGREAPESLGKILFGLLLDCRLRSAAEPGVAVLRTPELGR